MWLDVDYLTRLPAFDVLLFRWTLDGFILFLVVKRGYSSEKKNEPKCIAPLEYINGLFENVKKKQMQKKQYLKMWITFLFGVPPKALRVPLGEYLSRSDLQEKLGLSSNPFSFLLHLPLPSPLSSMQHSFPTPSSLFYTFLLFFPPIWSPSPWCNRCCSGAAWLCVSPLYSLQMGSDWPQSVGPR